VPSAHAVVACDNPTGSTATNGFFVGVRVGPAPTGYAFALADRPTVASYVPAAATQDTPTTANVSITRTGTGRYRVKLPGVGTGAGAPMVSAHGPQVAWCTAGPTTRAGGAATVGVNCYDSGSDPLDSAFTIQFATTTNLAGRSAPGGWALATRPLVTSYIPASYRNVGGSSVHVWRAATGRYKVTFRGQEAGDSQLTLAVGTGGDAECSGTGRAGSVMVFCWSRQYVPVNAPFAVHLVNPDG
jgi:hypothetical protein